MAVSPLLQIRAIRAHGSSQGVSVAYQQVLFVGFILWISYGVALHNLCDHHPEHRRGGRQRRDRSPSRGYYR